MQNGSPAATRGAEWDARHVADYLDILPDVVLLVQPDGLRVLDLRPRTGPVFGYQPDDLCGRSVDEIVPGATRALFEDYLAGRHDRTPTRRCAWWCARTMAPRRRPTSG